MYSTEKPFVKIDINRIDESIVSCKLITGIAAPVDMLLKRSDYEDLLRAGFFEDAKSLDNGVVKTTETYKLINTTE